MLVLKRCSSCFGALLVLKVVQDGSARCADGHLHVVLFLKRSSYFRIFFSKKKRLRYTGLSVSPIMASIRQRMAYDV